MNDRHICKAKRTDNGEWVEGNVIEDGLTGQVFIHIAGNSVNESDKVNEEGCLKFFAFEVDPETVCQYTGKKDKNGKKIWENDAVRTNRGRVCKVVWFSSNCHQGFDLRPLEDKNPPPTQWNLWMDLEVLGNVCDGSEWAEGR